MKTCFLLALAATACTTLGPMPATTAISAIPADRPGVEAQAGAVPAFFLSSAASSLADGEEVPTQQVSAVFEPDRLLGTKGLIMGARGWGEDHAFEPMIGLRRKLDDSLSIAGIAYGSRVHGESTGASYHATRAGGELAIDATLLPLASWLAIHGQASVSATYLSAHGRYCVAPDGDAVDCDSDGHDRFVNGNLEGIYGAATASLALDIARRPTGVVHAVRIAMLGAIGGMPRMRNGEQEHGDTYHSIGLTLTLSIGSDR